MPNLDHKSLARRIVKASRFTAWLLMLAIIFLSVVPPAFRPETSAPHSLEHFSIFFATGLTFGFGYKISIILLAAELTIFAGLIEIAQIAIPGRHARVSDFVVDALAACIGVLASVLLTRDRAI